jgi:two-component system response regulator NreC
MNRIKVAIVDDHKLFREGLAMLLARNEDLEIIVSASNGKDFISNLELKENIPDVVLLDLTMPEMDGFEVLIKLKKKYPSVKAIALSMHDDGNYITKCVRFGAYGYLLKNADEDELVLAICTVYDGKKYFNQDITRRMINLMAVEGNSPKKLTTKETEIISLIAEGKTTKEIAEKLHISTRTVETHRVNMMKKLEVKNSSELINKASKLDILE